MNALLSRLRAVAPILLGSRGEIGSPPSGPLDDDDAAGSLAEAIARSLAASPGSDRVWLAIVAFTTVFPTLDEHTAVRRRLGLAEQGDELEQFLGALAPLIERADSLDSELVLIEGGVVVDADFSGRSDHNTGVQRVLRETVSRWAPLHEIALVAWNDNGTALRALVGSERDRVLDWPAHSRRTPAERESRSADAEAEERARTAGRPIVVPVNSVVVEIEVAAARVADRLAGLAGASGNRVAIVGHDTIPIVSSASQEAGEIERFARFLTVVKLSARLAGVSRSAATEYEGFVRAVSAQGIRGPEVVVVPLAMNPPSIPDARAAVLAPERVLPATATLSIDPLVVVVGSQEPRKNHAAILFAAERLFDAGTRFRLRFIGGGGALHLRWFDGEIARLQKKGLAVEVLRGAPDDVLVSSYREARFTVFPSLHEGFGLPVAESLALGTPVITADHGSLAEAAAGGGCLMVDPRDDEALAVAMSSLLADDELYTRLAAEATERSFRTWDDYARELWSALVEPVQSGRAQGDRDGALQQPDESLEPGIREPVEARAHYAELTLERWWAASNAAVAERLARQNSLGYQVAKVGPLVTFFVARSREMGVVAAGKAAFRVVKRRAISR